MDSKTKYIHGKYIFIPFLIFFLAFSYRFNGIKNNHPFWVDEFNTASQAKVFMSNGVAALTDPSIPFEYHNITTHILTAVSFNIFGFEEWAARLPFVLIGSLVPIVVLYVGKKMFDDITGLLAALLTTTSYFMITWSRQARGYVLLQLLILVTTYVYLSILTSKTIPVRKIALLSLLIAFGVLTHVTFLLLVIAIGLHFLLFKRGFIVAALKSPAVLSILTIGFFIIYIAGIPQKLISYLNSGAIGTNNLWYYHSFLWREYGLITLLAGLGIGIALKTRFKATFLVVLYVFFQLIFVSFIFKPYVSRYLLTIFPFLFIFMAYTITYLVSSFVKAEFSGLNKLATYTLSVLIFIVIIMNGYKFDIKPNSFYSVNHDFREIALIDYDEIYSIIVNKGKLEDGKTVVIDTWWDRARWYLGQDYQPLIIFRWSEDSGLTNGLARSTPYEMRNGVKYLKNSDFQLISNVEDLKNVIVKYPHGFIFIDDASLPQDVIAYAKTKLKEEKYLDRYPLDDNPLSHWPATLYSWGLNTNEKKPPVFLSK